MDLLSRLWGSLGPFYLYNPSEPIGQLLCHTPVCSEPNFYREPNIIHRKPPLSYVISGVNGTLVVTARSRMELRVNSFPRGGWYGPKPERLTSPQALRISVVRSDWHPEIEQNARLSRGDQPAWHLHEDDASPSRSRVDSDNMPKIFHSRCAHFNNWMTELSLTEASNEREANEYISASEESSKGFMERTFSYANMRYTTIQFSLTYSSLLRHAMTCAGRRTCQRQA